MTHGRDKYQSRKNRALIREVLMRDWDPIGVHGVPEAADEYDGYVADVYVMLMYDQATAEAITDYLIKIVTVDMALSTAWAAIERSRLVADKLVALRPEFESS